ncbi:MAG: 5-formyltetrahydrofolate cyclo-ligase [Sulfuriferula multivorans]|uniref:5-formyltetrahydrofolate cyclo-ligase n=1 Tax=Sulfuriferula multivorans TaxID=1559896 RepID=A0A7C9NZ39_9PROT|nr:5-formyltetrahydrofolate cyclo-ligase [Sulfuriferula multivorans]
MNKFDLRRQLKAARKTFTPTARRLAARASLRLALRHGLLLSARRIGFYLPQGSEFDIRPLLEQAQMMKRLCFLPMLPQRGRMMRFGKIGRKTHMTKNRYGIAEPVDAHALRARQLDLLFMPLVGFDHEGYRLGMGGGYYDATLAFMQHRRLSRKPRLVGIAYECQRVEALPHDPWDMPLDAVLTERQLYRFTSRTR